MITNLFKIIIVSAIAFSLACTKSNTCCEAELIPDCVHTLEINPVCGCNGVTYSNASEASCNSITDVMPGPCSLVGTYNFLGFKSDGAKIGIDKQVYSGKAISLILKEDADNDLVYPFEGKGQPNLFAGTYNIVGSKYIITVLTEAVGSDMEQRFVRVLPRVVFTKSEGEYLYMISNDDLGEELIFKKE
jgi:hypothetical protein